MIKRLVVMGVTLPVFVFVLYLIFDPAIKSEVKSEKTKIHLTDCNHK